MCSVTANVFNGIPGFFDCVSLQLYGAHTPASDAWLLYVLGVVVMYMEKQSIVEGKAGCELFAGLEVGLINPQIEYTCLLQSQVWTINS